MKDTGHVSVDEPFAGLFTQGMVNHESYRTAEGPNGRWLYPEEVERRADGTTVLRGSDEPVIVGRVEAMSKSKRNTIDPGAIIARYGADTARWFILSDNPPERDMEWTESGAAGAFRFTQRVFRLAEALDPGLHAECNSRHHQAVRLDESFTARIAALSPDGIVEAIDVPGRRWAVGVQWHPEYPHDAEIEAAHRPLFTAFVQAASE